MGAGSVINDMIEQRLMGIHTAFLGKIIALRDENKFADIQPLADMKQRDGKIIKRAIIKDVPVLNHARHRLIEFEQDCVINNNNGCNESSCSCQKEKRTHIKLEKIKSGDLAFCVCSESDITRARVGEQCAPPIGRHEIKDAVVVGVLDI